jgi:hypothetical protein
MKKRTYILAFTLYLVLMLAALCSCSVLMPTVDVPEVLNTEQAELSKKDQRRINRDSKKIERILRRSPELRYIDTAAVAMQIRTPEISRTITPPLLVPDTAYFFIKTSDTTYIETEVEPFYFDFNDQFLSARFNYDGYVPSLDYTIHPIEVDTTAQVTFETIQPTRYPKKHNRIQEWVLGWGWLCLGLLVLAVISKAFKLW